MGTLAGQRQGMTRLTLFLYSVNCYNYRGRVNKSLAPVLTSMCQGDGKIYITALLEKTE